MNLKENLKREARDEILSSNRENVRGYTLNNTIYEEPTDTTEADSEILTDSILTMLGSFEHGDRCNLYQNVKYLCNTVTKLGKPNPGVSQISIHDVMAFLCHYCGHGDMNKGMARDGVVKEIGNHRMNECSDKCCGLFLDRQNLQLGGGECGCGVEVLLR